MLVLHWDGKIIQLLSGQTEDRLAIAVSSPNTIPGQFIASPAIADGTGETMAECVYRCIEEFELLDNVEAVVFDTTASNTGKWSGSVTRFEAMLKRSLITGITSHSYSLNMQAQQFVVLLKVLTIHCSKNSRNGSRFLIWMKNLCGNGQLMSMIAEFHSLSEISNGLIIT